MSISKLIPSREKHYERKMLISIGIQSKIVNVIKSMYDNSECTLTISPINFRVSRSISALKYSHRKSALKGAHFGDTYSRSNVIKSNSKSLFNPSAETGAIDTIAMQRRTYFTISNIMI